jgi:tRNA (guanine-N7-)-methyltransferase
MEPGKKRVNMPKKAKYRTRAHVNPMGELNIPTPLNPAYIDWSFHYPSFFGIQDNRKDQMFANTYKYPVKYLESPSDNQDKYPTIVDIGCGYGGLMFELSKEYPEKMILGMEIRDLVANFVVDKANSLRVNSGYKECMNIGVVKTNTMKTIHNYFRKGSVSIFSDIMSNEARRLVRLKN